MPRILSASHCARTRPRPRVVRARHAVNALVLIRVCLVSPAGCCLGVPRAACRPALEWIACNLHARLRTSNFVALSRAGLCSAAAASVWATPP